MHSFRYRLWLIGTSLLICASAQAETLSRGGAVQRALAQNPQVAAARAVVDQARARQGQVEAARYPNISLTVGIGPSLKAELEPGTALQSTENAYGDVGWGDLSVVFGGVLSVVQPLYTFGKIDLRQEATEHEIRARQAQADMTRADVAFRVAELYESLLFARDARLFFEEMTHGLKSTLRRTETEVAAERLPEGDLLRLQTAQAYLDLGQHQSDAGQVQATAGLVAYLGMPAGSPIEPADAHLELLPISRLSDAQLLKLALQHRPELHATREAQAAFEKLAQAEEAGNWPDFFAAAFASGAYTPGRDFVDTRFVSDPLNHFVPGALVGARWQFQNGMADQRAAESRARALEMQQMEKWATVGMPAEITVALEDIRRAKADFDSTELAVQRAKKWSVQAAADFALGLGDSSDVEDATATYVRLRLANFRARFEYNVAVASLAKATGMLTAPGGDLYPTKD